MLLYIHGCKWWNQEMNYKWLWIQNILNSLHAITVYWWWYLGVSLPGFQSSWSLEIFMNSFSSNFMVGWCLYHIYGHDSSLVSLSLLSSSVAAAASCDIMLSELIRTRCTLVKDIPFVIDVGLVWLPPSLPRIIVCCINSLPRSHQHSSKMLQGVHWKSWHSDVAAP